MAIRSPRYENAIEYIRFIFVDWWSLISGALSIPFSVLAAFDFGHTRALCTILAFVALLIASCGLIKRILELKEKQRPKLQLECDSVNNRSCRSATTINYMTRGNSSPFMTTQAIFFRMIVSVNAPNVVKGCKVSILNIKFGNKELLNPDKLEVNFTHCPDEEKFNKTIANNVPDYVDILLIEESLDILQVRPSKTEVRIPARFVPNSIDMQKMFLEKGEYSIAVVVSSDSGTSSLATLKFTWSGDSENSKLELLPS